MNEPITDNTAQHRYELQVEGTTAYVAYSRAPGTITLNHTIVPEAFAGQGIGSRLAKFVLDTARERGDKVIVRCSFIAAYLKKHPEYNELVVH
ncbi:MAG: GNAT family N-acetyltransferase [Rudaea sp.]